MIDIANRDAALTEQLRFFAGSADRMSGPSNFQYKSMYAYVLENGAPEAEIPLTANEREWFDAATRRVRYPIKECFSNSQRFVLGVSHGLWDRGDTQLPEGWTLTYVEGYVMPDWIPMMIHHGWVRLNGKVIDLTLRYRPGEHANYKKRDRWWDRAIGMFPGRAYRGVTFNVGKVAAHVVQYKEWGTLIECHHDGYKLLRGNGGTNVVSAG
jgi:hypothetical protein